MTEPQYEEIDVPDLGDDEPDEGVLDEDDTYTESGDATCDC